MKSSKDALMAELYTHDSACSCGCQNTEGLDHALAKLDQGIRLQIALSYPYQCQQVWQLFIDHRGFYPGLQFQDLRPGATLTGRDAKDQESTFMLMDFEPNQLLSFAWFNQAILTFEWQSIQEGQACLLSLDYWFPEMTQPILADLSAWYRGFKAIGAELKQEALVIDSAEEALFRQHIEKEIAKQTGLGL